MKLKIVATAVAVGGLGLFVAFDAALAQHDHYMRDSTAEGPSMVQHQNMAPSTDGAFHHRFDGADKWASEFDKAERDAWQKPHEVIEALKLDGVASVADIGAGTGYFAMKIARHLPNGRVFAADIEPDMVRYLGERATREGLMNVVPVQGAADSANLPEPVDLAVVVDTFHHLGNRVAYFTGLRASLNPGARLVIVDFKKDSPNGPPVEYRIPPEKVAGELKAAGFKLIQSEDFLPRQYFLVFEAGA